MKCGTTTLAKILKNHPDIGFCKIKQPHFFSKNKNWKKNIDNYHRLFDFKSEKVLGEASTSYTKYPIENLEIWNDIFEYNCEMKFIYIIRNPIERAVSHYMHNYLKGYINSTIEEELLKLRIINSSRYFTQLKPFIEKFGLDKFLIINFDDLINNRSDVLSEISDFLNIDFQKFKDFEKVHRNKSIRSFQKPKKQREWGNFFKSMRIYPIFKIFPKRTKEKIAKTLFNNQKRIFNKRIELSDKYKNLILNLTILDIIEMEKITKKDLSNGKQI